MKTVPQNAASTKASMSNQILATLGTYCPLTLSLNYLFCVRAAAWDEAHTALMGLGCYTEHTEPVV